MRKQWLQKAVAICLAGVLLGGCAEKKVDYQLEKGQTDQGKNTDTGNLEKLKTTEKWNDTWTVKDANGEKVDVSINADVTVPDAESMSVVEVIQTPMDATFKEQILKAFFQESDIYYYDISHRSKEELEQEITSQEEMIQLHEENLKTITNEDTREYVNNNLDEAEKILEQCQKALLTASDTRTKAESYEACNEYLGFINEIPYYVYFSTDEIPEVHIQMGYPYDTISASYDAPETLKDKSHVNFYSDTDTSEAPITEQKTDTELENTCSISQKDAEAQAKQLLTKMGLGEKVCTSQSPILWDGYNDTDSADEESDLETVSYGYFFRFGTGINNIAFSSFGLATDYLLAGNSVIAAGVPNELSDDIRVYVTDKGVISIDILNPITVTKVTNQVEILPLSTIQELMKNEVSEHPEKYDFKEYRYMTDMELIYFPVRDKDDSSKLSYLPVWRLSSQHYINPVLINGIDGSVIYLDDLLS